MSPRLWRQAFLTVLFGACSASVAGCAEAGGDEVPNVSHPAVTVGGLNELCNAVDLRPSPDGLLLAVQSRSLERVPRRVMLGGQVSVVGTRCLFDPELDGCRVSTIRSVAGVLEPQWNEAANAISVVGNSPRGWPGWVLGFDVEARGADLPVMTYKDGASFQARPYDLIRPGANAQDIVTQAAEYDRAVLAADAQGDLPIGGYWAGARFVGYLSETRTSLDLVQSRPEAGSRPVGVPSVFLPDAGLALDEAGRPNLVATGYRADLNGTESGLQTRFHRPVYDGATGRIAGTFSGRSVTLTGDLERAAGEIETRLAEYGDAQLAAVSALKSKGQVWAIARRAGGDVVLLQADTRDGGASDRVIGCGSAPALPEIDIAYDDWGASGHEMPATLYRPKAARTLIVFLHGGPGRNGQGATLSPNVLAYLEQGLAVAVVEYSGSTGSGLSIPARVRTLGPEAQRLDARYLSLAIERLRTDYDLVGIHAESFGGALLTHPALTGWDFAVGVAPYVRHRDPASWRFNRVGGVALRYQRGFESAFFGEPGSRAREGFENDLEARLASWTPSKPVLLVIGGRDDYAQPSDFQRLLARSNVKLVVLPGANHNTVFWDDAGRREIAAFTAGVQDLSRRSPPRASAGR